MTDLVLTIKECAELLGCTVRTIWNKMNSGELSFVIIKGKGKKKRLISLSSLPEEAQEKYYGIQKVKQQELDEEWLKKPQRVREKVDFKLQTVEFYHQAKQAKMSPSEFLEDYNRRFECSVTVRQLQYWQRQYREGGKEALIDNRGSARRGLDTIPPEAWVYFCKLFLTQQKRGIKLCYDLTKEQYPKIPSITTFQRKVHTIPHDVYIFHREGEKAYNDKCAPYVQRTHEGLDSNSLWCSDHHRCDFFIKHPTKSGVVCRPWLTAFTDINSGKVMSWILRVEDPNSYVVKKCFANGVKKYGLPEAVYFDNGKDYKEKSFKQDYPLSITNMLGIKVHYAQPYHGQSKPIERFFKTFEERCGKLFDTYAGKDAKNRPEQMKVPDSVIYKKAPTLDEARSEVQKFINKFHNTPSRAIDMNGRTPNQAYKEELKHKIVPNRYETLDILCGTFEERTVQRSGYLSFKTRNYRHDELLPHVGERVIINYNPDNLDLLYVFDQEVQLICKAEPTVVTMYHNVTGEEMREAQHIKKKARKAVKEYLDIDKRDTIQIVADIQREQHFKEMEESPEFKKEVAKVIPILDKQAKGITSDLKDTNIDEEQCNDWTRKYIERFWERKKAENQ